MDCHMWCSRTNPFDTIATIALIREEYANLEEFIKSKKIKMKNELNEETSVTYAELGDDSDEDMDSSRKRRRKEEVTSYRDDQDEDEESRKWNIKCVIIEFIDNWQWRFSADEDFAPGSDSEVAEEFDSNASASDDDEDAMSDEDWGINLKLWLRWHWSPCHPK